jgi:transcriptional regulator with XRE-family HTH domain
MICGGDMEPAESSGKARFGAELKAQRLAKSWTQVELGKKLGYSGSFVSDVERGDRTASGDFAKRCDEVFSLPGTFLRLWEDIEREAYPTWFAPVVPIEREADKISGWEIGAVPGLLQTDAYARSVIRVRRPRDDEDAVQRTVEARMERQAILTRPKPPMLWYVLAEAVLRHIVGDQDVMAAQLDKLIKAAESPGVVIQALPYTAHEHAGIEGPVYLFERTGQPTVAYCECFAGGRLVEDESEVSDLATVVAMLRADALSPRDSLALMRTIRRDLD